MDLLVVELCGEEAGDSLDDGAHGEGTVGKHLKIPPHGESSYF